MKVFFSHASQLSSLVREVRGQLPRFLDDWLDEDRLCWGENLSVSIASAIRTGCDFVLIFLDERALRSDWVRKELEWALEREDEIGRTFLLPIVVESIPPDALPDSLRSRVQLRLADHKQASVSALASQIAERLFQLIAKSFDSQQGGEAQDHDKPNLRDKVAQLAERIVQDDFLSDVIVGIPRGGLVVAAYLSKQMQRSKPIPVVSLWPYIGFENSFENSFNHVVFTRGDFEVKEPDAVKVLIVDDICRSGRTLRDARAYLEGRIDASSFVIRTAAISYYEGQYTVATAPNYLVDKPSEPIRDFRGDVEPAAR